MNAQDLLRELKRTVDELQAFNDIGKTLTSTLDIKEVLRIIMQKVSELLIPGNWSLLLVDERTGELYFEVAVGEGAEALKPLRLKLGEGLAGWVAREGQAVLVDDAEGDPRFARRFDEITGKRTRSVLAVPLRSKGRILGVIELVNSYPAGEPVKTPPPESRIFGPDDLRTMATIADYAAIAIENARNFERIRELTLIDDHTGLYNARHLYKTLEAEVARSKRFARKFSVIFFDLDRFKLVNDKHGHQCGSSLLKEIGSVLLGHLRTVDVATRYGGDEFVILLPESDRAAALGCAQRLRKAIGEQKFLGDRGLEVHVTASFGIATYPDDATNGEDILRLADTAMYRVKDAGRDGIEAADAAKPAAAPELVGVS